jgi:hypothetical protein
MNMTCVCGHVIRDTTDRLRDKAYLLADEDWFLVTQGGRDDSLTIHDLLRNMREIYQCDACGRLAIPDPATDVFLWYVPENDRRTQVLRSMYGNGYKVRIIGLWRSTWANGVLWWEEPGARHGRAVERFSDKATLKQRYFDVLQLLMAEGRLGSACLRQDNEVEHIWEGGDLGGEVRS